MEYKDIFEINCIESIETYLKENPPCCFECKSLLEGNYERAVMPPIRVIENINTIEEPSRHIDKNFIGKECPKCKAKYGFVRHIKWQ